PAHRGARGGPRDGAAAGHADQTGHGDQRGGCRAPPPVGRAHPRRRRDGWVPGSRPHRRPGGLAGPGTRDRPRQWATFSSDNGPAIGPSLEVIQVSGSPGGGITKTWLTPSFAYSSIDATNSAGSPGSPTNRMVFLMSEYGRPTWAQCPRR